MMRIYAMAVSIVIALATALVLASAEAGLSWSGDEWALIGKGLLIGIAAVPVAPVAKDPVTAIQSAATALRGRR